MKKIKIGVLGFGQFSGSFIPLFQSHPGVSEVVVAELSPERRADARKQFQLKEVYANEKELIDSDVDAVAVFTLRFDHVRHSLAAMRAGKHVYSAVPAATTLEELQEMIDTVESTGQIYMMGETSHYYPQTVFCRKKYQAGEFGRIVYGEGEYYHPMEGQGGFYEVYKQSHGKDWLKYAGIPPMAYPTHSFAMILSVTGARATHVSCMGFDDSHHEDKVFGKGKNIWDNPFSNETAICQLSDGAVARINEFRRVGISHTNHVRLSLYGDKASFEEQASHLPGHRPNIIWSTLDGKAEDLGDILSCESHVEPDMSFDSCLGLSQVHDADRLPKSFNGQRNGHYGSHQFLVDDFVNACLSGKHPVNNIWDAARYNAPGIVAHESAIKGGERLPVPDFGKAPV